ncbi:response regulator [Halorhabdus amylolytica]|uniref:response regulator n=1 Tax=Halorhabdus amylolytica TaxID=2559573 RepID=UPI0010A9FA26|nr:response regulator [Halorhabdus amylolytica]
MDSVSVLCVDDDPDLVALTATNLRRVEDSLDITTVTDPQRALEEVSTSAVDCVVSDYEMPGMDGLDLLEAVREDHPDLPFILFTGKGSEEVASEAIARGVTDYLQKGTGENRYDLLANRVTNAVEKYRAGKRAETLDRIRGILRDVNRSLVRAEDREALEHRVCEIVATADPYRQACIVTPSGSEAFDVRVRVGDGTFESVGEYASDMTVVCPVDSALQKGEIETVSIEGGAPETDRERALLERGYDATAAIPISYDSRDYGVLCLFADETDAFDAEERALLAEIGEDLSHAIYRAELHDRLRRDERIISNLPVGVYRHSPLPDGTLLSVNPELVELFDADDAEDLLGRPFRELYADPDDREQFVAALKRDGVVRGMELELETLSGEPFHASVTGIMTEEGDQRYFDGVVSDVTDRHDRERTLRHYETLFEIAPIGFFRTTAAGDPRDTNSQLADLLAYESPVAAIAAIDDLAAELYADPGRPKTFLDRLLSIGSISGFEIDVRDRESERRGLSIDATRLERSEDD